MSSILILEELSPRVWYTGSLNESPYPLITAPVNELPKVSYAIENVVSGVGGSTPLPLYVSVTPDEYFTAFFIIFAILFVSLANEWIVNCPFASPIWSNANIAFILFF